MARQVAVVLSPWWLGMVVIWVVSWWYVVVMRSDMGAEAEKGKSSHFQEI